MKIRIVKNPLLSIWKYHVQYKRFGIWWTYRKTDYLNVAEYCFEALKEDGPGFKIIKEGDADAL